MSLSLTHILGNTYSGRHDRYHKDGYAELRADDERLRDPTREADMSDNKSTDKESVLTDKEEFGKNEGNNPQDHKPVSDMDESSPTKSAMQAPI